MEGSVANFERRAFRSRERVVGIFQCRGGKFWVEPFEGAAQTVWQEGFGVVGTPGRRRVGREVRPISCLPANVAQPIEGGGFDGGFGSAVQVAASASPSAS